jgi:thioredoxin 1
MAIDAPIHSNANNLPRVLGAGLPVLLVFWQKDCSPCDQLAPTLDKLAKSYAGRALIVKINAADEPALLGRYNISALPSIVFVKGGKELETAVGVAAERDLAAWLDHLTRSAGRPPVPSGASIPVSAPAATYAPGYAAGGTARPAGQTYEAAGGSRSPAQGGGPSTAAGQGVPIVLTDASFDQVIRNSEVPVMVDFWAVWCGPCKMVAPVVEQLGREYAGRALMAKLNVDENPAVASRYGIQSIPTLMIFKKGQVVDRIVGAQPAPVLRQRLAQQVR